MVKEKKEIDFLAKFEKDFGDVCITGDKLFDSPPKIVKVSPSIDLAIGGIPEGTWTLLSGPEKCGKGQPLYSKIYTPTGPILMKDIKVGDIVCSPDGTTTKVTGVFPQGKKQVYRIYFKNSIFVDCDEDHLWVIKDRNKIKKEECISTKELLKRILFTREKNKIYDKKYKKYNLSIQTSITQFNTQDIDLHPYIMGVLLGDGSFRSVILTLSSADSFIVDKVNKFLPKGFKFKKQQTSKYCFNLNSNRKSQENIRQSIKKYGLMGKLSYQKHIPNEYIYNSIENRILLIQGLLDTDGNVEVHKNGAISIIFNTSSKILANQFQFLIESIGGICSINSRFTFYTHNGAKLRGKRSYRCYVSYSKPEKLVSLPRKKILIRKRIRPVRYFIHKIDKLNKIETQCIKVAKKDGLYITDHFICTHNTSIALQIAANAQEQFNKEVYYISAEGRFTKLNLTSVSTLKLDTFHRIQSTQDKILSAEDLLNITIEIIKNKPGCVIIIDSVSSLCADKEMGEDLTSSTRAATPKLLASFCRRMGTVIPIQKTIIICILHLQANMSGYGSPWNEDGGKFLQYQADIKLRAKGIEKIKNKDGKQIGQLVKWSVLSSALGAPGSEIESYLRYGHGIDKTMESIVLAKDLGLIIQKGAWYHSTLFEDKFQGEENLYDYLVNNQDKLKLLLDEIKKMI